MEHASTHAAISRSRSNEHRDVCDFSDDLEIHERVREVVLYEDPSVPVGVTHDQAPPVRIFAVRRQPTLTIGVVTNPERPDAPGFETVTIAPRPGGSLTWAEATYRGPRGRIRSRWDRDGDTLVLDVEVPCGTTANVVVPGRGTTTVGAGRHRITTRS